MYNTAFAASLQSNVTGCAGVELLAGLKRLGVPGVGGGLDEVTVNGADCEMFSRPQIFSNVVEETDTVVIGKFALVAPPGIVTVAGTDATPKSVES